MVAFLSNVSPSFSANFDLTRAPFESAKSIVVAYPQSILSAYDDDDKENYLTALNVALTSKVNASEDYTNFLTKNLSGMSDYSPAVNVLTAESKNVLAKTLNAGGQDKKSLISLQSFVVDSSADQQLSQDDENTDIINVSNILRSGSTEGMQRDVSGNNVIFGVIINAKTTECVVIGYKAQARLDDDDSKDLASSVVIGSKSQIHRGGSVVVGANTETLGNDAVAVGRFIRVEENAGTALGFKTQVKVAGGVALGSDSVANRAPGVFGYTPLLQGPAINTES
ncbi:hypothetical protein [Bartonella heixiaziensis]|uniref:hypothetical protein n=1 Tax=Bartonella heixiaziensis TaxID=1461000 RepID=UPI003D243324